MKNQVVIVTGATNGIGEITALELARKGATVVIISRSESKCQATVAKIKQETGNPDVDYIVADLSVLSEMRSAAEQFLAKYQQLNVLVNNAGGYFSDRIETADGLEQTFALNHMSYFVLTQLLLDTLIQTAAETGEARIINVSSEAHRATSGVSFDDLQHKQDYSGFRVYGESKLMNILFTYRLAEKLAGTNVAVNALHPGFVRTGFGKNNSGIFSFFFNLATPFAISPEKGAQTSIYLASSPDVKGVSGAYWASSKRKDSNSASHDQVAQEKLWAVSESLMASTAEVAK